MRKGNFKEPSDPTLWCAWFKARTGYDVYVPPGFAIKGHYKRYHELEIFVKGSYTALVFVRCKKCKRYLDKAEFYRGRSPCKPCQKLQVRRWQKANPAKKRTYATRYRIKMMKMGSKAKVG
jgi:hypothetical protein